ncbi:MAG: helix-turn-helix transcriptional regulator [Clostridia bacterium]|nr:helix-turn-helix transcriptional regulator [Clostridia bacterium]
MRLKYLRKKRHLSQTRLAMELNISQNTVSRYETGSHEPDIKALIRIADYFNVSIDYLLERTDNPDILK